MSSVGSFSSGIVAFRDLYLIYGPYIKYKSLNATIPEEKDPTELTMEEALILIEKRKEYDKTKKAKKSKKKGK